jgi:hypothetical protein
MFAKVFGGRQTSAEPDMVSVLFSNTSALAMRCSLSQRQLKVCGDIGPGVKGVCFVLLSSSFILADGVCRNSGKGKGAEVH